MDITNKIKRSFESDFKPDKIRIFKLVENSFQYIEYHVEISIKSSITMKGYVQFVTEKNR